MYGKILTSILRSDVYTTSRPTCDWVYISLIPAQALGYKASFTCVVYEYLYTDEFIRWRSGLLSFEFLIVGWLCMGVCDLCVH